MSRKVELGLKNRSRGDVELVYFDVVDVASYHGSEGVPQFLLGFLLLFMRGSIIIKSW